MVASLPCSIVCGDGEAAKTKPHPSLRQNLCTSSALQHPRSNTSSNFYSYWLLPSGCLIFLTRISARSQMYAVKGEKQAAMCPLESLGSLKNMRAHCAIWLYKMYQFDRFYVYVQSLDSYLFSHLSGAFFLIYHQAFSCLISTSFPVFRPASSTPRRTNKTPHN